MVDVEIGLKKKERRNN